MKALAENFLAHVLKAEKAITLLAFVVMTLVVIADVFSRKITGLGIVGAPRIAVFGMVITAFISFGLASSARRHLRPKFADGWFPVGWDAAITRCQEYLTALFCLIFAVVAVSVVYETYLLQETTRMLRLPVWPMQAIIPIAFGIGTLRHIIYGTYLDLRPDLGDEEGTEIPHGDSTKGEGA